MKLMKVLIRFEHQPNFAHLARRIAMNMQFEVITGLGIALGSREIIARFDCYGDLEKIYMTIHYIRCYCKHRSNRVLSVEFLDDDLVEPSD